MSNSSEPERTSDTARSRAPEFRRSIVCPGGAGQLPVTRILPPNHCVRVLLLGLGAWLVGILGLIALGTGVDDLQKIKKGGPRPEGRGFIIVGMISGVLGLIINLGYLIAHCGKL